MDSEKRENQNVKKAMLLSIIPGLGQFYNGQKFKGFIFLGLAIIFVVEMILFGFSAFNGLITLGSTPMEDHSLFLMIEGTLQLIITILFIFFYVININDAKRVAKIWRAGGKVNQTPKEIIANMLDNGFPYLLTFPAYIAMIFTIIFPVLVTVFMAFTNYDFYHIPPASLIDWVGFKNFFSIFF